MTTRPTEIPSNTKLLPILAGLLVLCLGVAAALTAMSRSSTPVAAPAEQLSLVVQRMPFEAQNALRGESSDFDALAKSVARLKTSRAAMPGTGAGAVSGPGGASAAEWTKLTDGVTTVGEARASV